ncbi:hypothetical protein JCM10908_004017 [Rhodotorula pacifica]|uniref:RlpA-like double-psi beta-barrel domain-containing protein n=1 Tax=Rhodotorula pacifica TaxID=1495444 RepID=UPI00316C8C64
MFSSATLIAAVAAFSAVQAAPISLAVVESSLQVPNTTYSNVSVVNYRMTGVTGACGWVTKATDLSVGLPRELFSDLETVSPYCGLYAVVVDPRTNKTATALIADGSDQNNTLSVSDATWAALNGTDSSLKYVNWRFANETETAAAKKAYSSSSDAAPSSSSSYVAPAPSSSSAAAKVASSSPAAEAATTSTWEAPSSSAKPQTTTTSQWVAPTTTTTQWVAPTTTTTSQWVASTTQAAKAVSNANSGSYSGQATFYTQGGVAGSCGTVHGDGDYIVAMNVAQVDGGSHCGQTVHITNTATGASISATVADTCPGCSYGSLDLSTGAFGALGSYDQGVLPISWGFA